MTSDDVIRIIAFNLRKYRKQSGLTQEALAWKAHRSPDFIGRLEGGEQNVSIKTLAALATVLKIELAVLFEPIEGA